MGVTLQRTAYSTNIKIRRDHTCALFDSDLRHVAQHDIAPQHIGSLVSVVPRNVPDWEDDLEPGDGVLINDPYKGAVHLPDVMLISPLFHDGEIIGYAANSAHHVDIGGGTPGGIPNDSTELYAEGMIIPGPRGRRLGVRRGHVGVRPQERPGAEDAPRGLSGPDGCEPDR